MCPSMIYTSGVNLIFELLARAIVTITINLRVAHISATNNATLDLCPTDEKYQLSTYPVGNF